MTAGEVHEFRIDIAQDDVDELRERVRRTRWASDPADTGWDRGLPAGVLREFAAHWVDDGPAGYDWRRHEARLNEVPQFRTEIDGQPVHLLHARSDDPDAIPLLLTHGWPGSVLEFVELIGPLTAPGPGACHVVVPALPGYGFSSPLVGTGWTPDRIADTWLELMTRLGYERFAVQGGDWGSRVSRQVAVHAPDRVVGVHLNMLIGPVPKDPAVHEGLTELEQAHLARARWFIREGRGYNLLQSTRPDTIGYALADSPVGQLAWILEKFHDWTDPTVPFGGIDRDTLLTNVSLYWFTRTAGSSAQLYWEQRHDRVDTRPCEVPMAMAVFAHDLAPAIRRFSEDGNTFVRWTEFPDGGHFAALERPADLVADVREFLAAR